VRLQTSHKYLKIKQHHKALTEGTNITESSITSNTCTKRWGLALALSKVFYSTRGQAMPLENTQQKAFILC